MFSPLVHRLQKLCLRSATAQIARQWLRVSPERLIQHLPALGNVLYIPMHSGAASMNGMRRGVLVEAMSLAPLAQVHWLTLASVITVDGPREWMECVDAEHRVCARIHLLPDTDYLAWDALLECGERVPELQATETAPELAPASAQMLRFRAQHLAGLHILVAELATSASSLSRDLAGRIARDDALPLQLSAIE